MQHLTCDKFRLFLSISYVHFFTLYLRSAEHAFTQRQTNLWIIPGSHPGDLKQIRCAGKRDQEIHGHIVLHHHYRLVRGSIPSWPLYINAFISPVFASLAALLSRLHFVAHKSRLVKCALMRIRCTLFPGFQLLRRARSRAWSAFTIW